MKVLIKLFQKFAGRGRSPRRARRRETFSAFLFCQAFCFAPEVSKKKAGKELGHVTLRNFSPFFLSKELQKEPKTAWLGFVPAGATRALPSTREPLKRLERNFYPVGVIRLGGRRKNVI